MATTVDILISIGLRAFCINCSVPGSSVRKTSGSLLFGGVFSNRSAPAGKPQARAGLALYSQLGGLIAAIVGNFRLLTKAVSFWGALHTGTGGRRMAVVPTP